VGTKPGGIDSHLEKLQEATLLWLEYEDKGETDEMLLHLALEDAEKPEMPEGLAFLRESRRFGLPVWDGTLFDMPSIFRQELNTIMNAETEYMVMKAKNELIAQAAKEKEQAYATQASGPR
jgi:hypothetical protein